MPKSSTQRYRVTAEFVLRDRSDYEYYRKQLQAAFDSLQSRDIGIIVDYLSIEKKEDH